MPNATSNGVSNPGTGSWGFNPDGSITDANGNSISFDKLLILDNGTVKDINGNILPLSVTDSSSLGGKDSSEYLTKVESAQESSCVLWRGGPSLTCDTYSFRVLPLDITLKAFPKFSSYLEISTITYEVVI